MPTPKKGYHLSDGTRIPSVTTIINRYKDSGGLIWWAWNEGIEGRDYRDTRDKAADAGTLAHEMVEDWLTTGREPRPIDGDSDVEEKALGAFCAFLSWWNQSKIQVIDQEMQMVSEEHRFGGTPDAIGEFDGELCLLDWKSSNRIYQDYLIQLAAYKALWEENNPDKPLTGGFHLCRFAKEHGDFSHHYFPNLDEAWEAFLLMRRLYDLDKELKKRAA